MKTHILQHVIEFLNVFARRQTFILLLPSNLTCQTCGLTHRISPDAVFKKQLKSLAVRVFGMPASPAAVHHLRVKCKYHSTALLGR